jgi:hypothetical protein
LVLRCRKPYYLHSLSRIYLSKHVYYLGLKIGSQVKHPVIDFDIFTFGYPKLLFETTKISTHPNLTQQESNYIYLYTTKFRTSIKIRLNRKFESTEHRLDVYNQKLSIHNKCAWVGIHQLLWKVHKGSVLSIELFVGN